MERLIISIVKLKRILLPVNGVFWSLYMLIWVVGYIIELPSIGQVVYNALDSVGVLDLFDFSNDSILMFLIYGGIIIFISNILLSIIFVRKRDIVMLWLIPLIEYVLFSVSGSSYYLKTHFNISDPVMDHILCVIAGMGIILPIISCGLLWVNIQQEIKNKKPTIS